MHIVALKPMESAVIDRGRWRSLRVEFGSAGAVAVMERALAEILDSCARIEAAADCGDVLRAARQARRIVRVSGEVALGTIAQAAVDAAHCVEARDEIALAAVLARICRLARDVHTQVVAGGSGNRGQDG
jgi:hypothetical protein